MLQQGYNLTSFGYLQRGFNMSASADAIAALYSGAFADVGFYLPLNDRTYMWQEHTGETPVMEQGDTVGLVLDKSQGVRVVETLGPELVTNGTFDTDSDWTKGTGWAISGGAATKTPGTAGAINQTSSLEAGKTYKCVVTISGFTTGALYWRLGSTTNLGIMGANGAITQYLEAPATGTYLGLFADINFDGSIDNISVREVQRTLTGLGDELFDASIAAASISGPNESFDSGTGYYTAIRDAANGNGVITLTGALEANTWYRVEYERAEENTYANDRDYISVGGTIPTVSNFTGTSTVVKFVKTTNTNAAEMLGGPNVDYSWSARNWSIKKVPGNHAYQNTAASRPIWNATEEGVDFDGTDDALKVDAISGLTTTMSLMGVLRSDDGVFSILQTFDNPVDRVIDGLTGSSESGDADPFYADGVKIYNASRDDVKNAIAQSVLSDSFFEARDDDLDAWATDNVSLAGGDNGAFFLDGIFKGNLVLTSNTSTTALDAARAQIASAEGITLRNTETLTDQVATGGVYGPSNDTRLMFQDTDGEPYTEESTDPVGLIINPAEGVSVSTPYGNKWAPHNLWSADANIAFENVVSSKSGEVYTLTENAATNSRFRISSSNSSLVMGGFQHTVTIDAKLGARRYLIIKDSGNGGGTVFDLLNGVVTAVNGGNGQITDLGDGFFRCSITWTPGSNRAVFFQASEIVALDDTYDAAGGDVALTYRRARVYRSDRGGMADSPDYPDDPTYVPTTGTAVEPTLGDRTFSGLGTAVNAGSLRVYRQSPDPQLTPTFTTTLTAGKFYRITSVHPTVWSGIGATLRIGGSPANAEPVVGFSSVATPNAVTYERIFRSKVTSATVNISGDSDGVDYTFDELYIEEIPGAHLYQTTAAARPLYDEASGLYDFDGTDDHFIADLTGIGTRTNMYVGCVVETTDSSAVLFAGSGPGPDLFAWNSGDAVSAAQNAGPGGSLYVDGTLQTGLTRAGLHAIVADGSRHLIEVVGCTLALGNYDTMNIGRFGAASFVYDGLAGDFVLIPDPGVVGRNIIRRDILARHPSITFAGA